MDDGALRDRFNGCRFDPERPVGHYESWFQRLNHPTRPLAFWSRYTIFSPAARPDQAEAELWGIYFDGENRRISAAKQVLPLSRCRFGRDRLDVTMGDAWLRDGHCTGRARGGSHTLGWDLRYRDGQRPLLLLPERFYSTRFPKAKGVVGTPTVLIMREAPSKWTAPR